MKKFINLTAVVVLVCMLATMACGCSGKSSDDETSAESSVTEATIETAEETTAAAETTPVSPLTDEMALDAIITHCVLDNPEFAGIGADHWVIISSTDSEIVVLFTSYTGSENRYYIDRATGETTVTELVPGIIDEEQATGETFNARDFLAAEIYG